jgi:DNA invertase Pin-like site-specific DNA recombinase
MNRAVVYARFSSTEQAKGYSLERQPSHGREYVARMGWKLDREIFDEGRSAFHGTNRSEGAALHEFEQEARNGLHRDTTLCVENLDRLSRQGAKATAQLVWALNEQGVSIATWHDEPPRDCRRP